MENEKYSIVEIHEQRYELDQEPHLLFMLNSCPQEAFIINDCRQIVVTNKAFIEFFGISDQDRILGKKLGEALGCEILKQYSASECGTSNDCKYCNANSILEKKSSSESISSECLFITNDGKEHFFDFSIEGSSLVVNEKNYQICYLKNIATLKRKEVLEQVFFHDVKNSIGSLVSLLDLVMHTPLDDDKYLHNLLSTAYEISCVINEEVTLQEQLLKAEQGVMELSVQEIELDDIVNGVIEQWTGFASIYGTTLSCKTSEIPVILRTDSNLVRRVLSNLIKNAIEASDRDGNVQLLASYITAEGQVLFTVKNSQYIPENVQSRLFHRSFSTKGHGRGIGVYSSKMFTEEFLHGQITFDSEKETGTKFYVKIPLILSEQADLGSDTN